MSHLSKNTKKTVNLGNNHRRINQTHKRVIITITIISSKGVIQDNKPGGWEGT